MNRCFRIFLVLLALGCGAKPRAPELQDDDSYTSTREGIAFRLPQGWMQQAKAEVPPGKLKGERLLVEYRNPSSRAGFRLTVCDLSAVENLERYLARAFDGLEWHLEGTPELVEVGTIQGRRCVLSARSGGTEMRREVTAVRRDARMYFFTATCSARDRTSLAEIRAVIKGVRWAN